MFEFSKEPGPVSICQDKIPAVLRADTFPSKVLTKISLIKNKNKALDNM